MNPCINCGEVVGSNAPAPIVCSPLCLGELDLVTSQAEFNAILDGFDIR